MNINGRKSSLKYLLTLIFTALFLSVTFNSPANYSRVPGFYKILASGSISGSDTTKPLFGRSKKAAAKAAQAAADKARRDSLHRAADTIPHDSAFLAGDTMPDSLGRRRVRVHDSLDYKISKDTMAASIDYKASDSVVMDIPSKKITLYNKASTKYQDATLEAYKIEYDQQKNLVFASPGGVDSNGLPIQQPVMSSADSKMHSDSITYSIKSKKGYTQHTNTSSGEMYVHAEKMKKVSENEYDAYRGIFTTCNLDTPHFAFRTNKLILINKAMAITGPIHPEFEGVPIPIYLPFGFFPISTGRHSGFLPPQFTDNEQAGVGLEGLGYYKVFNDYFDLTTRVNVYSYGGWNLYLTPTYRKRYSYSGQMQFALQNTRLLSDFGTDAYTTSKTFSFSWGHTVDSKARPGTNFSANVNLMSTKYNTYLPNNPNANYSNQIGSSITYSKTWDGKYNLTLGATHSQNNLSRQITASLPNLTFSAPTIYPLQKKDFVGTPKWYEKLGIGLSSTISGGASWYDSAVNFKQVFDSVFQWGAQNSIPITLALPSTGPFQITPGVSLSNRVYSRMVFRHYDPIRNKIDTDGIKKGLWQANNMSLSISLSTAIFGTFQNFGKNSKLMGIRHVIRPTVSLSYTPDLSTGQYYNLQTPWSDSTKRRSPYTQRVSYFDGSTYGAFGEGVFGGISFGLDNHFEIKTRSKSDTTNGGIKKTTIIDGIGFNGSYNYLADSFKLSQISFYFRSTLLQKINITGGATLDPYRFDSLTGRDKNVYAWQGAKGFHLGNLGRITGGNLAISTSFKSKPKDDKLEKEKEQTEQDQIPMTMEEQQAQLNYIRSNPAQFADFNIPWSLNLSYALNFSSAEKPDYSGFATTITSSLNWSGDFNLTEKWKVMLSGYYDVQAEKLQTITASISRDMHCWQMSINVTPVGLNHYFNITISPKAGILQDLRINRSKYFYTE